MKDEKDIRIMQLLSDNVRAQNELAFVKSRHRNCVPLEDHKALEAECDTYRKMWESEKSERADERKSHQEREAEWTKKEADYERRLKEKDKEISDLQDANALLTADKFGPSSEQMEKIFGKMTDVPKDKAGMLALLSHKGYECDKAIASEAAESVGGRGNEKEETKVIRAESPSKPRKPRGKDKKPRGVYVGKDGIVVPVDNSNLPAGSKLIVSEEKGAWVFRMFYARRMKFFSVAYRMARFNVPGSDPANSRYPDTLYKGCHLTPSFLGFYHRFKIDYNNPEQNILKIMKECGCDMPQSTLNAMMMDTMAYMRKRLEPAMLAEIKTSLFTHNDETRINVKYEDEKTGRILYHEGYVHAILSPSAGLVLMRYDKGSRKHDIAEEFFKGSSIECFVCDKAKMYPRIVKDVGDGKIRIGYCWGHGRRELYWGFKVDKRLKPIIELIGYLYDIERQCREENLNEKDRRQRRQDLARPTVDLIFSKLKKIVKRPDRFGKRVIDACNYLLNDEEGFRAYLDEGLMEIDNNPIERSFRHIAVGRGTWQHCGGHGGAENLAFFYGLQQSCRLNGIDYGNYIEYIAERMIAGETDMTSLLPNHVEIPSDWVPEGERMAMELDKAQAS